MQARLKQRLDAHRRATADPRATGMGHELDEVMRRFPALSPGVAKQHEGR